MPIVDVVEPMCRVNPAPQDAVPPFLLLCAASTCGDLKMTPMAFKSQTCVTGALSPVQKMRTRDVLGFGASRVQHKA